jgi:hypothetical protein
MASEGTYQNAESIKCVTVTGPYWIDWNCTVHHKWFKSVCSLLFLFITYWHSFRFANTK